MRLKLIYFSGCPNVQPAKDLIASAGLAADEVDQDDLPESDPLRGYSSPTLLIGDKILFGSAVGVGGGCSLGLPSPDEFQKLIRDLR